MKLPTMQLFLASIYLLTLRHKYPILESIKLILFTQYQRPGIEPHKKIRLSFNSVYFNFMFVRYKTKRLNILNRMAEAL
jgi:hypothetical protein